MLSVKQGGIKYHFLSLWYDSTWDWTQVSRAIGEHLLFEILMKNMKTDTEEAQNKPLSAIVVLYRVER